MSAALPALGGAELRALTRSLVGARDDQIARVVAMVDALPQRGEADALIAPLRPRLAQLGMRRPLNFGRLLYTPLDPVIVPGPRWRRGMLAVPRNALTPLTGLVRGSLGSRAAAMDAAIAARRVEDETTILRAGSGLWPEAARLLLSSPCPADWPAASGLAETDYPGIVATIAAVLAQAVAVQTMVANAATGRPPEARALRAVLDGATRLGPRAVGIMTAVLLARFPRQIDLFGIVLEACQSAGDPAARACADQAVDYTLDTLAGQLQHGGNSSAELGPAARSAENMACLLAGLEAKATHHRPDRKRRMDEMRGQLDTACRERFRSVLAKGLLAPLQALGGPPSDAEFAALEATARDLKRFELAGRRLGGGESYDKLLRAAAAGVAPQQGIGLADRVRMIEILAGPEAALALLEAPRPT